MPWLNHPAVSSPVSFWRWLLFNIGEHLEHLGSRMVRKALYPDGDDIPF